MTSSAEESSDPERYGSTDLPLTNSCSLDQCALSISSAIVLETIVTLTFSVIVFFNWWIFDDSHNLTSLLFPLCTILTGLFGCLFVGMSCVINKQRSSIAKGAFKTKWWLTQYSISYYIVIIISIMIDMSIRYYYNCSRAQISIVLSNWLGLVGSSSGVSLLLTDIPCLSLKSFANNNATRKYACTLIAITFAAVQIILVLFGLNIYTGKFHKSYLYWNILKHLILIKLCCDSYWYCHT